MASQKYKDRRINAARARLAKFERRQADLREQLAENRRYMAAERGTITWLEQMPVDELLPLDGPDGQGGQG